MLADQANRGIFEANKGRSHYSQNDMAAILGTSRQAIAKRIRLGETVYARNLLCRMLDAQPLRDALTGTTAELALIVSAHIHDTILLRHPSLIDPSLFRPVKTKVKRTRVSGWIYVPGSPPP